MSLLANLLHSPPRRSPEIEERLWRLAERTPPPTRNRHSASRYVAVAVESTGPEARRDHLLAIGAVSVDRGRIDLSPCFDVGLGQPESSSRDAILRRGVGGQRQLSGAEAVEALVGFLEFVAHAPLVAFHAEFARSVLDRALKEHLSVRTQSPWIDLARVLPALYPSSESRTMDDWLQLMKIQRIAPHGALAEALATAQMLQVCMPMADSHNLTCPQHLIEVRKAQRRSARR